MHLPFRPPGVTVSHFCIFFFLIFIDKFIVTHLINVRLMYDPVTSQIITFCCILTLDQLTKGFWILVRSMTYTHPDNVCTDHLDEVMQEKADLCREISIWSQRSAGLKPSYHLLISSVHSVYHHVIWWLAKTFEFRVKLLQFTMFWH